MICRVLDINMKIPSLQSNFNFSAPAGYSA
ncbi:hypothetical protein ACX6T8_005664, partial [Escherichia coli]|nr:hypothetical protein [Escherichia coli]